MFTTDELNFLCDYYQESPEQNQIKFAQGINRYYSEYPLDWDINVGDLLEKIIFMPPHQFKNVVAMLRDFWQMEEDTADERFEKLGLLLF